MVARIFNGSITTTDGRTAVLAYAAVTVLTGLTGYMILSDAAMWPTAPGGIGIYDGWMIFASGLAGLTSLMIARGWVGTPGALGAVRACFGALVMLILASLIGGSLITPIYGTIYAPFIVLSAFLENPVVAALWCSGVFIAHWLLAQVERKRLAILSAQEKQAQSSLSPLSQAYFYRK
ncbi:hypothetical protein [Yoonia vestfoldensis]|uniref:hypothetical protein n=1 Tax=Yoonia vestfoldensis TaxID=245188 RepID=UPI00035CF77B|nr:hypothetical protein [Yoonia vestfoldensis]